MPHPPSQGYGVASIQRRKRQNQIFLFVRLSDYKHRMPEFPPEEVTPFVFSDPTGKRWPRLRLILLIGGVLFFLGTVLFVQTLFVTPHMNVPFSLRQLKGQLKALQKENPAGQLSASSLLWQKFSAARQAAKKLAGPAKTTSQRPRKKTPDNIYFYALSDNVYRFVAILFDETSDTDPPGPLASRSWFEGWLRVLLQDSNTRQWIIAIGSYGYDWTIGGKKAELISFSEAMSRANDAEIKNAEVAGPSYSPYFYFQDEDKEHAVWFLDAATFLNQLREARDQKAGGFALYRLGSEDPAIWDALSVP